VLLDLGLPDVPGLEVATQLAATRETMPIVALTGRALETDREACLRAGCTEYLVKPLDSERLLRVLDGQLLKPGAAAD
jgi:DNA-binding response OmpR family regulator